MVLLDTSVLIECFTDDKPFAPVLLDLLRQGRRFAVLSLVLYEWLRGPRTALDIENQETMFPSAECLPFGPEEAALSAQLYRSVRRARSREIDIAIAAYAIRNQAELWTLNEADFADIPGLRLFDSKV